MTATPARARPRSVGAPPHRRTVLPGGLRVVTQAMPGARSASVAIFVPVGSRHEDEAHAGLSHFLEHLVFKGTRAHPESGALSQLVEGIGGSVNASTDRELTVFSAKVPSERTDVALHAVSELALHPLLRARDLSSEKPVIVDEIRMYVDSPSDHVFTLFDELLFGQHPLGREIAGTIARGPSRDARRGRRALAIRRTGLGAWSSPWPVRSITTRSSRAAADWRAAGPATNGAPARRPPVAAPGAAARAAGLPAGVASPAQPGQPLPRHARRRARRSGPLGARPARRHPRRRDGQPPLPGAARAAIARL